MFRYRLITAMFIIIAFMMIGWLGSGIALMEGPLQEGFNRNNLIRLHVIANSNSAEDQAVKLKVRDKIVEVTEPWLLKIEDPAQAEFILKKQLEYIKKTAETELVRNGKDMPVQVSLGRFSFPERIYPFGTLPAGEYKGIRVIIGEGAGENWWCVLYPPLCLLDKDAPAFKGIKPGEAPKVEYHLATLETLVKENGLTMDEFWKGWGKFFGLL